MRIVIAAPGYNETKGGHLVIHKLCDSLIRQGLPAYLKFTNPYRTAVNPKYISQVTTDFDPENDIAIYHDSINGNPWRAKKIITWLLYRPKYQVQGVPIYYTEAFGHGHYMRIIEPFLDLFFDSGNLRFGDCWTWRKAGKEGWSESDKPQSGFEIQRGLEHQEIAWVFNIKNRFTSYDGATFLNVQAALCGCDSIVLKPVGGKFSYPGVATCEAEIEKARSEWPALRAMLEKEYQEQDAKAAEAVTWAMSKLSK